jgi:hypothetical protein
MDREPETLDLLAFLATFRQMLQNQSPTNEAELPSKLHKYGELCDEANRRLRECHALALRGQYANAVAVADREPNLLQRCSELEIPEREILGTVAQVLGVKTPTPVDHGLIQSLQDAYDKGTSSSANLRLLHKLTLARAPLPTRLNVMRKLLIQNPNHPFLDADIRTFEKAWFKQMPDFARALAKQERPELIQEILVDLAEAGYMETPPPSMVAQVETTLTKARMALFPSLSLLIRKAFVERSLETLTPLIDRWNALVEETGPPEAGIRAEVAGAMAWYRRESGLDRIDAERAEARSRLSYLLQAGATRSQLDLAYQQALDLDAIDPYLEKQYLDKLEEFDTSFKTKAVVIAVVAVVGLIVAVVFAAIRFTRTSSALQPEMQQHSPEWRIAGSSPGDPRLRESTSRSTRLPTRHPGSLVFVNASPFCADSFCFS